MCYIYLLQSVHCQNLYIGATSNLKKRFEEHNDGKSNYTKKYIPWKLIYYESYCSRKDAYRREHSLKLHAQGLRRLKERLRDTLSA